MKKILSLLVLCAVLLTALPFTVWAQEPASAAELPAQEPAATQSEVSQTTAETPAETEVPAQTPTAQQNPAASQNPGASQPEDPAATPEPEKKERPPKPGKAKDDRQALINEARWIYEVCRVEAGRESFQGVCGMMTSYQLWVMGINNWLFTTDGNKQFDTYSAMEKTSGGYYPKAYSAEDYSLEEALNLITRDGTRDVYNLIVGFEWTNTEAGAIYGHACVINAILDGKVYFVESFYTSLGGEEGNVVICTIEEFAKFFSDWTVYEGLVYFGTGQYVDCCDVYGTDLFLRARFDTVLRSQPCLVDKNDCRRLRNVTAGERLRATAVCVTPQGEVYYRINDGENVGYVAANAVYVLRMNGEDLSVEDVQIPVRVKYGVDFGISGTVTAELGKIGAIEVMVTNMQEEIVLRERMDIEAYTCNIDALNDQLLFDLLSRGNYRVQIYADAACVVAGRDGTQTRYERICLWDQNLQVGAGILKIEARTAEQEAFPDGWSWRNGTWYLYRDGAPCTGWAEDTGVQYYLQEDGSVSTGWTEVDGIMRHFSSTGALSSGWLETQEGIFYCGTDGVARTGWQSIDGVRYYFDEKGLMATGGKLRVGDKTYKIQPDGQAIEVKK